jgi:hypothetical protein
MRSEVVEHPGVSPYVQGYVGVLRCTNNSGTTFNRMEKNSLPAN